MSDWSDSSDSSDRLNSSTRAETSERESVIAGKSIHLRMDPAVHKRLKAEAERQGRSVTAQINYILIQECGRIARRRGKEG